MNPRIYSQLDEPRQFTAAKLKHNRAIMAWLRFGCVVGVMVATLSVSAQDIFLRIGGQAAAMGSQQSTPTLAGESTDPQYTNWIPVLSMSHGVTSTVGFGGGSGKANHQDVSFSKLLDRTTPSLCLAIMGTNVTASVTQPIDYVTLDFRKTGTTEVFYRVELQGVIFSSVQYGGAEGEGVPVDQVSFIYSKIRWSYVKYVSGKAQTPITTGWDVAANKAL